MLSPIIEYLLAQPRGAALDQPLCSPARWQYIVPVIRPGQQLSFTVAPPFGVEIAIKYAATFARDTVPGVFFQDVSQAGVKYGFGTIEEDWIRDWLMYFVVFTKSNPIYMQITNTSALNQRFVGTQWSILIHSQADAVEVLGLLNEYGNIASNDLARATNALLKDISETLKGRA